MIDTTSVVLLILLIIFIRRLKRAEIYNRPENVLSRTIRENRDMSSEMADALFKDPDRLKLETIKMCRECGINLNEYPKWETDLSNDRERRRLSTTVEKYILSKSGRFSSLFSDSYSLRGTIFDEKRHLCGIKYYDKIASNITAVHENLEVKYKDLLGKDIENVLEFRSSEDIYIKFELKSRG